MKECIRCKESKSLESFYTNKQKNKQYSECKICMNTRTIARMTRLKIQAIEYKGGSCEGCGYNKNPKALEFHHKDPSQKDFGISKVNRRSFENIKNELDKCILLCANCHREIHDEIWRKSSTTNWKIYDSLLKKWDIVFPKPKAIHYCKSKCGNKVSGKNRSCLTCDHKKQERISWPDDKELAKLVWEKPRTTLAKEFGVSDSAISKRCKLRGISKPPRGYWTKKKYQ
jgi:hypothetical protein